MARRAVERGERGSGWTHYVSVPDGRDTFCDQLGRPARVLRRDDDRYLVETLRGRRVLVLGGRRGA